MKGKKKAVEEEEKKEAEDTTPTATSVNDRHQATDDSMHEAALTNGTDLHEDGELKQEEEHK